MGGTPDAAVTSVFNSGTIDVSNATTYTFASQAFAAPSPSRHIVVGIAHRTTTDNAVTAVTIAGVSATYLFRNAVNQSNVEFYAAHVPAATSGSIVVTLNAETSRLAVSHWSVSNLQSLMPVATATFSLGNYSKNTTAPAKSVVFGMFYSNYAPGVTWSGLNEDFDATGSDGVVAQVSSASQTFASAANPLTVTITVTGENAPAGATITLR